MENCSYCGTKIDFGTGKMYVKKDAKILWFCSRRCEKCMLKLKRASRDYGFTASYAVAKRQRMAELSHHGGEGAVASAPAKKSKSAAHRSDEHGSATAAKKAAPKKAAVVEPEAEE